MNADRAGRAVANITTGIIIAVIFYTIFGKDPPKPAPAPVPIVNLVPGDMHISVPPVELQRPLSYVVLYETHTNTVHDITHEIKTVREPFNPYFYWPRS